VSSIWRTCVTFALTTLFGCGDNSSVAVCFGDAAFCHVALNPRAIPGPDQTVATGDVVTLDGSNSEPSGGIQSYSWTQTGGPSVTLADANKARASFVAPSVASNAILSFRLTVVDQTNHADTDTTQVTVQPAANAAVTAALALFEGPLQPAVAIPAIADCPSATADLPPDIAAAQRGLWLAARSIAIAKGVDAEDPSAFLDASRVLVATNAAPMAGVAGRIETFGLTLLGSLAQERDPALGEAVASRLTGAGMLDDPAALLNGGSEVTDTQGVALTPTPDTTQANERAIERLLASRGGCIDATQSLALTGAGLRVIAGAAAQGE
jgi:K319-like protein